MALGAAKPAPRPLAGQHPGHQVVSGQSVGLAQQVQRGQAPVHAAHAEVLCGEVLKAVPVLGTVGGRVEMPRVAGWDRQGDCGGGMCVCATWWPAGSHLLAYRQAPTSATQLPARRAR